MGKPLNSTIKSTLFISYVGILEVSTTLSDKTDASHVWKI